MSSLPSRVIAEDCDRSTSLYNSYSIFLLVLVILTLSLLSLQIAHRKEKWDASGANEAVGRVSASIPESTKTYVGSIFNRQHLRSISVCFGIGEERAFYVEKNPALLVERLRHNITFFYLNYLLLTAVLFILTTLLSPTTILGGALLGMAWLWFIRATASGTLSVGGLHIPQKTAALAMGVISIFLVMWLFQRVFWWTVFSSGFLVTVHAFFRDASMHKDLEDVVAMEGDLSVVGEDASFLNSGGSPV